MVVKHRTLEQKLCLHWDIRIVLFGFVEIPNTQRELFFSKFSWPLILKLKRSYHTLDLPLVQGSFCFITELCFVRKLWKCEWTDTRVYTLPGDDWKDEVSDAYWEMVIDRLLFAKVQLYYLFIVSFLTFQLNFVLLSISLWFRVCDQSTRLLLASIWTCLSWDWKFICVAKRS
mgnify:CR=1 FL=1